jgi:hypothetical protein
MGTSSIATLKDQPLPLGEVRVDGAVQCSDQLVALEPLERRRRLIGQTIPDRPSSSTFRSRARVASQPRRCSRITNLQARREACHTRYVQFGKNRHERIVRGLNAQIIHLLGSSRRQRGATPRRLAARHPNEQHAAA